MLNSKEIETITNKFIVECMKISPEICSKGFRNMAEGIISNDGSNKHLVVRSLNHQLIRMKRQQHILMEASKVKIRPSINEFVGRNIEPEVLKEIRSIFKGLE